MAISVKSVTTNAISNGGTSISVTTPSASVGDLLIIILSNDYYNFSELTLTSITPTATATEITAFGDDGGTNSAHFKAWWAPVTTAGAATVQADTAHADEEKTLVVYVLSGADTSSPIDAAASSGTTQTVQNPAAPSISPTTSDALLINHISSDSSTTAATSTVTPPGSASNTYSFTDPSIFMRSAGGSEQLSASGATGTRTWTGTRSDTNWIMGSMAIKTAAPTGLLLAASYSGTYNTTTSPKTLSVTTQPGDIVVVYGGGENSVSTISTPTGNSLTYTLQQSIVVTNNATAYIWTATDPTGGTNWTLSASCTSGNNWGISCLVFRNAQGIGVSGKANASGTPSLSLTTSAANSDIVVFSDDWNANDGTGRTWLTAGGITPSAANGLEVDYTYVNGAYTVYGAYYNNIASVGTVTVGLSAPTGQQYSLVAVEILGSTPTVIGATIAWLTA